MLVPRNLIRPILLLLMCAEYLSAQQTKTPKFSGASIPDPPEQRVRWEAPPATRELPANLISATTRLFEQGLADPRHGEYREIEVVGEVGWRTGQPLKTHGWLLPVKEVNQRFAVCWN